MFEIYYQT